MKQRKSIEQPSRRPVFNSICLICFEYRDSSLTLRVTMGAGRQSRNALASPLGEEGHEVAQGCTTLQVELILYAALTANRQPSRRLVFFSELVN